MESLSSAVKNLKGKVQNLEGEITSVKEKQKTMGSCAEDLRSRRCQHWTVCNFQEGFFFRFQNSLEKSLPAFEFWNPPELFEFWNSLENSPELLNLNFEILLRILNFEILWRNLLSFLNFEILWRILLSFLNFEILWRILLSFLNFEIWFFSKMHFSLLSLGKFQLCFLKMKLLQTLSTLEPEFFFFDFALGHKSKGKNKGP